MVDVSIERTSAGLFENLFKIKTVNGKNHKPSPTDVSKFNNALTHGYIYHPVIIS